MARQPKPDQRAYLISDSEMIEDSRLKLAIFKEDFAVFAAENPTLFSPQFILEWEAAIETACQNSDNQRILAEQTQLTQALQEQMEACRHRYQFAKGHIIQAFLGEPLIWNEFGVEQYIAVHRQALRMSFFMRKLYEVMQKYAPELAAVGWGAAHIEGIKEAAEALRLAHEAQELFMRSRPNLTQNRCDDLNKVFAFTSLVCRFGKLLFRKDAARRGRYSRAKRRNKAATSGQKG